MLDAFEPVAAARGVSLTAQVASTPLIAEIDHDRVLQVLANLVSNAIKFAERGGAVRLVAERVERRIRFIVTDDGPGIEREKVDAIFQRYWQAASYDRRGLGLGLYISKRIVEAHDGKIWVESEPGRGSNFFVTLPASAVAEA